ncbi:MAG: VTT domain-containing protein [Lautropia sp.]
MAITTGVAAAGPARDEPATAATGGTVAGAPIEESIGALRVEAPALDGPPGGEANRATRGACEHAVVTPPIPNTSRILQPGRNCWRIERAERFGVAVDAADYFRAVREAMKSANESIHILAWDIDSRLDLAPGEPDDGWPRELGAFLAALVRRKRRLRVRLLCWDYALVYSLEREWLSSWRFSMGLGAEARRLMFRLDSAHPVGGSHHQKLVVVDDALAFAGGIDLTRCRWDDSGHRPDNPLRRTPDGRPYQPFHDLQAAVDGPAALALGDLFRARWSRATGRPLKRRTLRAGWRRSRAPSGPAWPAAIEPLLEGVDVAISRTEPGWSGGDAVGEVRQLHLDLIAAARDGLYVENQYFTSSVVGDALAARLAEPDPPAIAIVSRRSEEGWLETMTMGVLRARLHRRLRERDPTARRYALLGPEIPGLEQGCLNVHSKLLIVDDLALSIGSANLNNRSMALDSECQLTVESGGDPRVEAAIAGLRHRLLAEHLDTVPGAVAEAERRARAGPARGHATLLETIAALARDGARRLTPIEATVDPEIDRLVPEHSVIDPERALDPDYLARELVPREARRPMTTRALGIGLVLLAMVALLLAWRFTPLRDALDIDSMRALLGRTDMGPATPLLVIAVFGLAGLVVVPVMLLIVVTGLVFGPWPGSAYALGGVLFSAALTYGVGRLLGRKPLRTLAGERVQHLSRKLGDSGIVAIAAVRVIPLAPFTIVNLFAGASHIRFRDYLIGTAISMAPGTVAMASLAGTAVDVFRDPTPLAIATLTGVAIAMVGIAWVAQRWFAR